MTQKVRILLLAVSVVAMSNADAFAAKGMTTWNRLCVSCHNGTTAPSASELSGKYATAGEFLESVKAKGAQCMNILKNDERTIRKIAREIGIPSQKQKE